MRTALKLLLILVTFVVWLPIPLLIITVIVGTATGCTVNEADTHPCIVAGHDIGEALYDGLMMVWAIVLAFPFMIGTVVLWVLFRRWKPTGTVA